MSIGVFAGPSYVDIRFDNDFTSRLFDPALAFEAGGNATWSLSNPLRLRTGLQLNRKGTRSNIFITDENGEILYQAKQNITFDYLSIPVMLEASVGQSFRGIFQLGPSFGFLLQQTSKIKTRQPFNVTSSSSHTDDFYRFEHAILLGLGLEKFINDKIALQVLARTAYGLNNIDKVSSPFIRDVEMRTFVVSGTVGFQYYLGR